MELITTTTTDGISLDGAWYPVKNSKLAALIVHGRGQNFYTSISRWLPSHFREIGISCLALNMRDHDHNEIDGLPYSKLDVGAGLDFLKSKGHNRVLLIGVSYGSNKTALALDSSDHQSQKIFGMILLSAGGIKTYIPEMWSTVLEQISHLNIPLLVIQAGDDEHIPEPYLAGAEILTSCPSTEKAQMVMIENANHGFAEHRKEVISTIDEWFRLQNFILST